MRAWYPHQSWSPQRLDAMLKDAHARESESWRKNLLTTDVDSRMDIGPYERDLAVDWLVHLNNHFGFHPETFFLAVHILDRFVAAVKVRPKYVKCMTVACLYIGSKILEEEEDIPGTAELVENSDCGCKARDVHRMESIILKKLYWNIHTPTPFTYLQIFHNSLCENIDPEREENLPFKERRSYQMTRHFAVMTRELQRVICNYQLAKFPSSALALALLSLDIERFEPDWSNVLAKIQKCAKVKSPDLISCRVVLLSLLPAQLSNPNLNKTASVCKKKKSITALPKREEDMLQVPNLAMSPSPQGIDTGTAQGNQEKHDEHIDQCDDTVNNHPTEMESVETAPLIHSEKASYSPQDDGYDSDKTLSASEGEEEINQKSKKHHQELRLRPLTYAEIVKCGILAAQEQDKNLEPTSVTQLQPPKNKTEPRLNLFSMIFGSKQENQLVMASSSG